MAGTAPHPEAIVGPIRDIARTVAQLSPATPHAEALLAAALDAMELDSKVDFGVIAEVAAQAERIASALGRADLRMRARLVRAEALLSEGDAPASGRIAHEALDWAVGHGHEYVLARGHLAVSSFRLHLGDLPDALAHAVQCVTHTGEDVSAAVRARHLSHLGVTLCESGSLDEARRRFRDGLDIATAIGDADLSVRLLNNLAYAVLKSGDATEAQRLVAEMRTISARRGAPLSPAYLDTIARVELVHHQYDEVEATLGPILDGRAGPVDDLSLAESLLTVAEARRLRGATTTAQQGLDRAREVCAGSDLQSVRARIREEQAQLFAATGDYHRAYEEYRLFHAETQALQSAQSEARARTLQAVFEAEEARRESERFREMAQRDPLTGLHNRRYVDEQLELLLRQAANRAAPLSAALIDLDYFKRINDNLSHAAGDAVLQRIAELLSGGAADSWLVARLGGEEFLLVLPDTDPGTAMRRCEEVRQAIAAHPWQPVTGALPVTASIGVTTVADADITPSALLARADRNLYAAKRSGRNRVVADPA
ncbi:diguanylate cyclase (GGDEF)-like protein [Krasilnikovia cinnamomea]|uniref:Diguanylate cyclase (GGDEF)-like protein n=2 Tax=Krasilnikovia cinnamomea TaxID=349313 RepID=A0A4Q7ZSQ3_9ACTN|nr:diguanylate cyclase (GGDEF)-like protein [Krasilnikovia cinnamomea]